MRPVLFASLPALLLAGCAAVDPQAVAGAAGPVSSYADLINASGTPMGRAEFARAPRGGVVIRVQASGLTPGQHGIHIHQNGACEAPGFTSAGPHLRAEGGSTTHGLLHPSGGEAGDLPNLVAGADGTAQAEFVTASVAEAPGGVAPAVVGRSIVIHALPDDQRTQPIGGSGDRIACGVVRTVR